LARKPKEAAAFYSVLAAAAVLGVLITFSPIDPIKALYWSAVINGIVAVPIMIVMMRMTGDRRVMGRFTIGGPLRWLGWICTLGMAGCVIGMIAGWII
jgi:Mn2+/Fe2+ NRAMP family transporter